MINRIMQQADGMNAFLFCYPKRLPRTDRVAATSKVGNYNGRGEGWHHHPARPLKNHRRGVGGLLAGRKLGAPCTFTLRL